MTNVGTLSYTFIQSPVGSLLAAGTKDTLHFLSFPTGHKAFGPKLDWHRCERPFSEVRRQLDAYFAGELRQFDLSIHLSGTGFQNSVWHHLASIPFGETRTYSELASDLGRPKASRTVGGANGNNPLPIILPCHRVIGADGSLIGFGGGLPTKEYLLRHEGVIGDNNQQLSLFHDQDNP